MLNSIASFLLHCTYFFTFSIECPCKYYPQHQSPFVFTMLLFPRASEESFPKWRDGDQFFYINLEASTLSLLPILQYFYEILPGSHADRANKESVLQRSGAARCAPAIIAQWYTGSVPEGCVYAIYSHDTVFFLPGLCYVFLPISFFILPLCFKENLFCVIEEGKPGQSIPPRVRARILSQPPCRSPVMSKRVAMKVSGVGHVPQP